MLEIWSSLHYLLFLITVHKLVLWYIAKKEDGTSEKSEVGNTVKERLDSYIYQIGFIILVSCVIEIGSSFYFAMKVVQAFKHFDQQGLTSAQVFYWRCSGAYYYTSHYEQKRMINMLDDTQNLWKAVERSYRGAVTIDNVTSGFSIDCSPGHSKRLKDVIASYKWDGPPPIQSETGCDHMIRKEDDNITMMGCS